MLAPRLRKTRLSRLSRAVGSRLVVSSCLIISSCLALTSCTKARDEKKGSPADQASADQASADRQGADPRLADPNIAKRKNAKGQPSAPSASKLDRRAKGQTPPLDSKEGPSYLVVLASWTLSSGKSAASLSEEWAALPSPQSVKIADGFPRPANAQESTELRTGYGALLAGVCPNSASAEKAVAALRAEDFNSYLKATQLKLPANCPIPSRKWQLDHELLLAAESDKPGALAAAVALLDQGASPHGVGARSPLDLAAYQNDIALARLLLERGARPNRPHRAPQQESALELALRTPHGDPFEMVQLLVKHGADMNAQTEGAEADPGSTVQLVAVRGCYPQILTYLQERGAAPHPVSADEVCRDRLPSAAVKTELLAILGIRSKDSL